MLSKALSSGVPTSALNSGLQPRSKSSGSSLLYTSDYPFPCLLCPEEPEEPEEDQQDDIAVKDQDTAADEDEFEFDDADLSKLRVVSSVAPFATSVPAESHLVGAVLVKFWVQSASLARTLLCCDHCSAASCNQLHHDITNLLLCSGGL